MHPRYKLLIAPLGILLLLCLYVFGSQSPAEKNILIPAAGEASCQQEQPAGKASKKADNDDLMMEHLSRQFIWVSSVN